MVCNGMHLQVGTATDLGGICGVVLDMSAETGFEPQRGLDSERSLLRMRPVQFEPTEHNFWDEKGITI